MTRCFLEGFLLAMDRRRALIVEECGSRKGDKGIRYSMQIFPASFLPLTINANCCLWAGNSAVELVGDGVNDSISCPLFPEHCRCLC